MAGGGEVVRKRTRDRGTCLLVHVEPSHIPLASATAHSPSLVLSTLFCSRRRRGTCSSQSSSSLFGLYARVHPSSSIIRGINFGETFLHHANTRSSVSDFFFFFFSSLLPPVLFSPHRVLGIYSVVYSYKERKKGDVRLILNTIHIYMYIRVYIVPSTSIWIL